MKITIALTQEETASIKALSIRFGTTPEEILSRFASDLTESRRSNGGDERVLANEYLERSMLDRRADHCPASLALSAEDLDTIDSLMDEALRERTNQ